MKVQWVIDQVLLERQDETVGYKKLEDAIVDCGHELITTKYVPFSEIPSFNARLLDFTRPVIFYGSVQFLNQLERYYSGNITILYFRKNRLKYSDYSWRYPYDMLNKDYYLLPYGEILARNKANKIKEHRMFVRPDVVTKTFAGQVLDFGIKGPTYLTPEDLYKYDNISDEEICVLAPIKNILGEYRFIICDHEVVGSSQYRYDDKLDIRIDIPDRALKLAKHVAMKKYQPDIVYTLDIATTNDGPFIIEFNAFPCSGLYACDTMNIVKHVSEAAIKEFIGEDD